MIAPEIQYVKTSDGVTIACAEYGTGPPIVCASNGFDLHMRHRLRPPISWDIPFARAGFSMILYDCRGFGSSRPCKSKRFGLPERVDDLLAVVEKMNVGRPFVLLGEAHGAATAISFAARHPESVSHLVLNSPYPSGAALYKTVDSVPFVEATTRIAGEVPWKVWVRTLLSISTKGLDDSERAKYAKVLETAVEAETYLAYREADSRIDLTDEFRGVKCPALVVNVSLIERVMPDSLCNTVAQGINASFQQTDDVIEAFATILKFLDTYKRGWRATRSEDRLSSGRLETLASTVNTERPDLQQHAAPDGTVTILFSDIEGSTAKTEELGDQRWMEVLREHNAIVREQLAAHEGFEVKSEGDGFMLAFQSARNAVLCAIETQRAFAKRAESSDQPIAVRIGLHTGDMIKERDDFFGKHVNLAARVAGQASGGEILVSSLLKELTASRGDIAFEEWREVELQGLTGTHQLYAVSWQ